MADADWHEYHSLRGRPVPESADLLGTTYRRVKILKNDFYACVALFERADAGHEPHAPNRVLHKTYHTDPLWRFVPLGWLGRLLARREAAFFERLSGVAGVPQLLARAGESTLIREYASGCNLREFRRADKQPDADYFPRLKAILAEIHARGLSHNDLSKPENLLVHDDGSPGVIDLQIAYAPNVRFPLLGRLRAVVLRYMQGVDRYHVGKLHQRARPEDFTAEQTEAALKKGFLLQLHGWLLRKPYRAVRHYVVKPLLRRKAG